MRASMSRVFFVISFFFIVTIVPLPSGLQNFCWKVSWQSYGSSFICYLLLFPVAFTILSLSLIFVTLITLHHCNHGVFLCGLILCGTLCFLDLGDYFPCQVSWSFSVNVLIRSLSTSTGLPSHEESSSKKSPGQSFLQAIFYMFN